MFANSTQSKHWLFAGETELAKHRSDANFNFINKHKGSKSQDEVTSHFLSVEEERKLSKSYETIIRNFCQNFQPPMPKCVIGTSLVFFKRFFVYNSNMDYHPRNIMLTCVYLASKVEEFFCPIGLFVRNLKGDREKYADVILSFELTVMEKLKYHLTVHNPYRPFEGFLIDIKTRFKEVENPENLRKVAEDFIERSFQSDACLIFSPSQIALAAIKYSASKQSISLDKYIKDFLLKTATDKEAEHMMHQLKKVKSVVKAVERVPPEQAQVISKKLETCRNQENNPDSNLYKQRIREGDDDVEFKPKKRKKNSDESVL